MKLLSALLLGPLLLVKALWKQIKYEREMKRGGSMPVRR